MHSLKTAIGQYPFIALGELEDVAGETRAGGGRYAIREQFFACSHE